MTARYEKEGKVIANGKWHLYDAQHAVVKPKNMSAYELQVGTIKASLDFYSYREAFRHLREGRGLFNFLIRIKGHQLAKRIVEDNVEYVRALKQLDEWQNGLREEYESWREWASRVIEDKTLGLDEKLDRVQRYINEKKKEVTESYNSLQQEFGPYCQEIADRMIERLRQHFENTIMGSGESAAMA